MAGNDSYALSVVKKAMELYVRHIQAKYLMLTHVKYSALRTIPHEKLQYSRHGYKLHSNYTVDCKDLPPSLRPISMILPLDAFQIFYLPT
jgi:hypothetical protein